MKKQETITELCPNCDNEVKIEPTLKRQTCPECGAEILPCSICLNLEQDPRCCKNCVLEIDDFMHKKQLIKAHVLSFIDDTNKAMIKNIDNVLESGAVDYDNWDEKYNPMILPRTIVLALLKHEIWQWEARGTSFEKKMKRESNNLSRFI